MKGVKSAGVTAGLLVAFSLALPTAATAGTIEVATVDVADRNGKELPVRVLRYRAAPGERNRLAIRFRRTFAEVADSAGLEAGDGCRLEPGEARCDFAATSRAETRYYGGDPIVEVDLGNGHDRVDVQGIAPNRDFAGSALSGGDGDDVLDGGKGAGIYIGGRGDDRMIGGGTFDVFEEGPTPSGSDTMLVGGSVSMVSYEHRSGPVQIDLRRNRQSGGRGERDRIVATTKGDNGALLVGGRGADRLVGDEADNALIGGRGRDRLAGGSGHDVLEVGGLGDFSDGFKPNSERTADRATGGPGNDYLLGNHGPNILVGGAGRDTLLAGPGRDRLLARDSSRDEVACGPGRDAALVDVSDNARARRADRCERIGRRGPALAVVLGGAGDNLGLAVSFRGNGEIGLACPGDAAPTCRGAVRLVRAGTLVARGRFGIGRGDKRVISLRVTRRGRDLVGTGTLNVQAVIRSRDRSGAVRSTRVRTAISEALG